VVNSAMPSNVFDENRVFSGGSSKVSGFSSSCTDQ
jgi:hypothetical protein